MRPAAASEAVRLAPPTSAALPIRSAATGRVRTAEAERRALCPSLVLEDAASGGRRARRSCTKMDYDEIFGARLAAVKSEGRYRTFANLARHAGSFPYADCLDENTGSKAVVTVWCSNDYLGMGEHPAVTRQMVQAIESNGAGAGGTRNISGTNRFHVELERELASLHRKESALLFT